MKALVLILFWSINFIFDLILILILIKAGSKLSVLSWLSNLMSFQQKLLIKSFVETQFGYCPLVWMFHGGELNRKIGQIHERPLRRVHKITITLSMIYLRTINLSVFTIETPRVSHWTLQSEAKLFQYNNEWCFLYHSIKL